MCRYLKKKEKEKKTEYSLLASLIQVNMFYFLSLGFLVWKNNQISGYTHKSWTCREGSQEAHVGGLPTRLIDELYGCCWYLF